MSSRSQRSASTGSSTDTRRTSGKSSTAEPDARRITAECLLALLIEYFRSEDAHRTPEKRAIGFLRAFTPLVLHVPPMSTVERLDREKHIVRRLQQDPSTENVRRLSQFHSVPMRTVVKGYQKATGNSVMSLREGGVASPASTAATPRRRRVVTRMPKPIRDAAGQLKMFT